MALIELRGKYATGKNTHAIIDNENYQWLNKDKWKAKPNADGNQIYAIRNKKINGRCRDIRMHREVIGAGDYRINGMDVDHINHNTLDNRKRNLRIVTRSVNQKNRKIKKWLQLCPVCGKENIVSGSCIRKYKLCNGCRPSKSNRRMTFYLRICCWCHKQFTTKDKRQIYCSIKCRYTYKNKKNRKPPILYKYQCLTCGKECTSYSKWVKFCSRTCNQKYRTRKKWDHPEGYKKKCALCSKIFISNSPLRKFCSKKCNSLYGYRTWYKKHRKEILQKKNCLYCGRIFETVYSRNKYCSKKCARRRRYIEKDI